MDKTLKYFLFSICMTVTHVSVCQQIPLYSQYFINPIIYNPATAGSENYSKLFVIHRDQWTAFPGMATSNMATFDSPIKNKVGLGLSIQNEKRGLTSKTGAYGYYSYKLKLSEYSKLVFGISLGAISTRLDFSKAIVQNTSDPYLLGTSPQVTAIDSKMGFLFTFKKLELGLSSLQLTENAFQSSNYVTFENRSRHFLFSSKYTFVLNEEKKIIFYPYLLAKITPGNLLQYDLNAVVDWKEKGWLAVSYRSNYAIGVYGGIKLFEKLRLGYAYDIITNPLMAYGGLSHEILLGYVFPDAKTRKYQKEIHAISKKLKKRGDSIIEQLSKCYEQKEHTSNKEEIEKIDEEIEKFRKELEKMKDVIEKKPAD